MPGSVTEVANTVNNKFLSSRTEWNCFSMELFDKLITGYKAILISKSYREDYGGAEDRP